VRVVVDTNIWVRGQLRRASYPGQVVDAWLAGRFTLITSEPLLEELADVLTRPKVRAKIRITPEEAAALVADMRTLSETVALPGTLRLCRDPEDDMVVETALVGQADVIVSQDDDLLSLSAPDLLVLTAPQFLALLLAQDQE
jgi:uncharacterized protein